MFKAESYGPVEALHQGRTWFGLRPFITVRCYAVDGLMIDTGLAAHRRATLEWARSLRVYRAAITHHHEDHSGSAFALKEQGVPVMGSEKTQCWMNQGFSLKFYQWVGWGPTRRTSLVDLPPEVETENHRFQVYMAPGHCDDQVVFHEANEGWLFSGDAFIAEGVKYFRADEDFAATMRSLERLLTLDFDKLFCAHRPRMSNGKEALKQKYQRLQDLEGKVREAHAQGLGVKAITRKVLGKEPTFLYLFSAGDLSKRNLVRSILYGPKLRKDQPSSLVRNSAVNTAT